MIRRVLTSTRYVVPVGDARTQIGAARAASSGWIVFCHPAPATSCAEMPSILEEAAVAVVDRAVGRRAPQHLRNRFRHLPQLAFARLDRALSPLPVLDVDIGAATI